MSNNTSDPLKASELAVLDEEMLYDSVTLQYLLSLLTEDDRAVLIDIAELNEKEIGYRKTNVPDFNKKRRKYEITWAKLEAQGLMAVHSIGNMRICRLTIRGKQAIQYINEHLKA